MNANQVYANQVYANQVNAYQVDANQVFANQVYAYQVDANQVYANQVYANHVNANQVDVIFLSSMYFSALVPCFRGLILRRVDFVFRPPQQNNTVYFQRRQELGSRDLPSTKLLRLLLPRSHHRMPPPHHLEAWYVVRVSVMVYNKDFIHGI